MCICKEKKTDSLAFNDLFPVNRYFMGFFFHEFFNKMMVGKTLSWKQACHSWYNRVSWREDS